MKILKTSNPELDVSDDDDDGGMRDSQLVAATGLQPQLVAAHSQEYRPRDEEKETWLVMKSSL